MEKFKVYVVEKSYMDYSAENEIVESAGGKCRDDSLPALEVMIRLPFWFSFHVTMIE